MLFVFHFSINFYKTDKFYGELRSSKERDVKWMSLNEMKHGRMAESMKEMLRVFLKEEISEYYGTKADEKWKFELK